ncbi:hypothetical protein GCM10025862_33080 [Arsenicicoccus piscis]|uniref:Glycosyl hydrolase family 32 n=2 Tax=Arsenicicoccus piscis TaxID=673954 RepID=A0ABQ6HTI8_9MICO|nr:hypothetical protein GCM10025862_33080 [Arsenicicoccus piscis]
MTSTPDLPNHRPDDLPRRPDVARAEVVVPAPGAGPGNWSGAPCAVHADGWWVIAYRVRRPVLDGRGVGVVVARSRDGVTFETVATAARDEFGAESLERPALVRLEDGWRLYVSCATPNSKHWWVESLTAPTLADLADGQRQIVFPGDDTVGVKDPVIVRDGDRWRAWLCCHPLTDAGHEDRMTTRYLTSDDGLAWTDQGEVLAGRPGRWDARGARVTALVAEEPLTLTYDGRPDAQSNWYETTGLAVEHDGALQPDEGWRAHSPHSDGALRYAALATAPNGTRRWYFEAARPDGAHDLFTAPA